MIHKKAKSFEKAKEITLVDFLSQLVNDKKPLEKTTQQKIKEVEQQLQQLRFEQEKLTKSKTKSKTIYKKVGEPFCHIQFDRFDLCDKTGFVNYQRLTQLEIKKITVCVENYINQNKVDIKDIIFIEIYDSFKDFINSLGESEVEFFKEFSKEKLGNTDIYLDQHHTIRVPNCKKLVKIIHK